MTDSSLPSLIQQMLQPDFYPHPVQPPIQLIQTHVSYVLLTGELAYKVKKPVDFGFLDYSTLEKRHFFCHEELRLNRRGAAELYLQVLPITQTGDQFHLKDDGEIVDYVVQMRQFPQETLLTSLYDRGELTEQLLQELAVAIAQFHSTAETNDYIRTFGTVLKVREAFDQNYEQTEAYIGGPQTQQQFDETRAYTDRFFAERQDLFSDRIHDNRIRECHGDIHLRNICLWNDKLLLFDCIEFNEPFRFVDVMYDIAYIVMDLEARQRSDLSTVFLNTYVEQTGDWEGLQILPLYVNRQSYVRAKVTSFLLDIPTIPDTEKQSASETAALYYRLAWQCVQPRQGRLFLMSGLSGSGKTTTARQLAKQVNGIHIRSDAVRKHLGGIPLQQRGDDQLYTPEMTEKTYGRLLELGITLAKEGYTVILDAKYDRQNLRQEAIAQARANQLPIQLIHCTAPLEVLSDRLQHRTGDIADATADLLPKQSLEPYSDAEQPFVATVDTTLPLEPQLKVFVP
ncbi:AAA family ATPase [Oscillatoria sp. FACHB-1407]|uniref:bifunctional aminoglycoside phosphotransferase/ATP-binding protein n=1 Tax=Oscillatoria sp. FACHB-1407 TaxID=2692847 RepID=UPI0016894CF9|nr:AAA family ATPase [Oscillatoria sp. FACHB-1407]MBD2460723.1 AAA family ATPase [Oscillatoria sp. FACHB-1407]